MTEPKTENLSDDLKKEVLEIYTPLSVAKKEVWKRWNDKELRKKVEEFLRGDIPQFLQKNPGAALVRHIASPNYELIYFLELTKQLGLDYRCVEFPEDKFVTCNKDKYYLCRLHMYNGLSKDIKEKISSKKIIEIQKCEGKKFSEIKTISGESLTDLHHKLLFNLAPQTREKLYDISPWFIRNGPRAGNYYLHYLALFICHGVLFENFSLKSEIKENGFNRKVVLPSIKKLVEIFGVKPLIVPIVPIESESLPHWEQYPLEVEKILKKEGY